MPLRHFTFYRLVNRRTHKFFVTLVGRGTRTVGRGAPIRQTWSPFELGEFGRDVNEFES